MRLNVIYFHKKVLNFMKWYHSNFKKNFIGEFIGEFIYTGNNIISNFRLDKKKLK